MRTNHDGNADRGAARPQQARAGDRHRSCVSSGAADGSSSATAVHHLPQPFHEYRIAPPPSWRDSEEHSRNIRWLLETVHLTTHLPPGGNMNAGPLGFDGIASGAVA